MSSRENPFLVFWRQLNAATAELGGSHVTSAEAYRHYVMRDRIEDAALECAVGAAAKTNVSAAAGDKRVEG